MDFTELTGLHSNLCMKNQLDRTNKQLRNSVYIHFANTDTLHILFGDFVTRFKSFVEGFILTVDTSQDILYSLLDAKQFHTDKQENRRDPLKIKIISQPLFSTINIAPDLRNPKRNIGALRMKEIGYQHLHLLHSASDSSNNSNSDDADSDASSVPEDAHITKKLKACEKTIVNIKRDFMFKHHRANYTKVDENKVHVDILIFVDKSVCRQLSKYLGLVYLEDLLIDHITSVHDISDTIYELRNKNNRFTRVLQSYINKKLISGYNNVCLIHTLELWDKITANARAIISNGGEPLNFVKAIRDTHFFIELNENHTIMDYLEAIALIVDNALHCETSLTARCCLQCDDDDDVKFVKVKLPLMSLVPLHVLRYFAQSAIIEKKSVFDFCKK